MKWSLAVLLAALVATAAVIVPESGYLLTAPQVLQAGTVERGCISLFNLAGPGRQLKLTFNKIYANPNHADFVLFSMWTNILDDVDANGEHCFDIDVPSKVTVRSARLIMELISTTSLNEYGDTQLNATSEVKLKPETLLTLVQTDKAKYRPGQKVLFRVISLSHDLTALNNDLSKVWITTPDGVRVAQWRNVKTNKGMVQLEMQLTEEPPLGRWMIHMTTPHGIVTKQFPVEEYVQPTFDVKIEAPSSIESYKKTVTAKVCAKDTFGKPLIGANVTINATADMDSRDYNENPDLVRNISDYQFSDDKGCVLFDLPVSKIGIGHHRFNTVTLTVVVEEDGTGLQQVETKRVSHMYSWIRLQEGDNLRMLLKPTLPYYGQYTLKRGYDKPVANEIVEVCYKATYKDRATRSSDEHKPVPKDVLYRAASKYSEHIETEFGYTPFFWETEWPQSHTTRGECREYRTDEHGSIIYYIPPQAEVVDAVHITTRTQIVGDSDSLSNWLKAFFSPSHSYLSIDAHLLPLLLPCSGDITIQLLTSQQGPLPPMVYKIMSRGRIIKTGQATHASLTLSLEPKMGPEFKLLVYYVMESGEVVSDSRVFKVDKCFLNQVEVSWDQDTVKPGDSASFTIRAAPNSVCGVSAVDKSTELLSTSNQITLDTVFDKLRQFVISRYDYHKQVDSDDKYCRTLQSTLVRSLRRGGATPFELADPRVTSGASADGRSARFGSWVHHDPKYRTDRDDAIKPFYEAGFLVISNLGLETRPCYKRVQAEELPEKIPGPTPVTCIFGTIEPPPIAPPEEEQIRDFFPEAFLFSIVTVDADGVKVLTSEMPDTITSWVGSAICTNSKDGFGLSNKTSITTFKPFFTKVSLPYSVKRGEVLNMSASVFNFLDSSLSVYLELAASEQYSLAESQSAAGFDLCIAAGRTGVSYFPLGFSALGEVNITVSVRVKDGNCDQFNTVSPGSDTVIRSIVIKPEGFPQEVTRSRFICLDKGDENHVETVALPVPEGLVPDSERAYFSVIGDLLGPTYQNLDRGLIKSPTGGGEPNMVTFVPNIYIRSYLEETGQLTERQRRQTEHNMKSGYQRQLRYRLRDGSFSAYGNDDPYGSLWLTAFVTKAFQEASKSNYIDIDSSVTSESVGWILRYQKPNGCFPRIGEVIHKELKGGTERGGEAALTAFVMLALKDVASSDQLAGGFACLDDGLLLPNKTLYSEILIAHTFLKMGQDVKGESMVVKLLKNAKREGDDILFWEGDRTSLFGGSRAVDVEMTSYMVLSLLHISGKGYLEKAARAVRWINTQRNSNGGFVATQDTIVAVKALTEFASRTFSSELTTVVSVTAGGPPAQLTVDATNRLLLQEEKIPDLTLPASVTFDVSPPGCAVVQSIFLYSSTLQVPDPAFSLGVTAKRHGRSGSSYEMEVCTSYIRSAGPADWVILEVEMPSGYTPVESTLRNLRQSRAVRKYSSSEGKVTFTLQTVSEDKTCLEFRIYQETEVDKLKPSVVMAYDLYRPEERNMKEYELPAAAAAY